MLLGMDEYPYHQITSTFAGVAGTDPAWNDGHYICLSDMAGEVGLASTLRLYQNNDVLDGFVCVRSAGKQHNIRLSRRLRPDMDTLAVGPLRLEIVEPLKALRLVLEDNEHGISADVTCRSTTLPYEDPAESPEPEGRRISERITVRGHGKCEGSGAPVRQPEGLPAQSTACPAGLVIPQSLRVTGETAGRATGRLAVRAGAAWQVFAAGRRWRA